MPDKVAIIIPAYNEAATINDIVLRCLAITKNVFVIDDGSVDETLAIIQQTTAHLLINPANQGKAASMWRGMQAALENGAEFIITLDADGQHAPEDIPRILDAAKKNPEKIIIGSRMSEKSAFPKKRYYANSVANFFISWAAGYEIEDSQSGFRLYPASLVRKLKIPYDKSRSFVFESEALIEGARMGYTSIFVAIPALYQENARASHFRSVLDIVRITLMVAWKINSRFLYLPGLYRGVIRPALRRARFDELGFHGLLSLLLSNLLIVGTLGLSYIWHWFRVLRLAKTSATDAREPNVVIVLGMRLKENKPVNDFVLRLERALNLYQKYDSIKYIILGGFTGSSRLTEAQCGADYLVSQGMSANNIHREESSRHTFENLVCARDLIKSSGSGRPVIISNRYHLARCRVFAKELGLDCELCAAEENFIFGPKNFFQIGLEAYYVHWFMVARLWSKITGAKFARHSSRKNIA